MAVRQHLYALQDEKMVNAEERPVPLGRPAKFWRLTREADRLFPDAYAELSVALLDAVGETFGSSGVDRLLQTRLARQKREYAMRIDRDAPLAKEATPARESSHRRRLHGRGSSRRAEGVCLYRKPLPDLRRRDSVSGTVRNRNRVVPVGSWTGRRHFTHRAHRQRRTPMRVSCERRHD